MRSLDTRQQLLVITMEECGELVQRCSKMLRTSWFDEKNRKKLVEEVGDVECMIELMVEWSLLDREDIEKRIEKKRQKLALWSDLVPDGEYGHTMCGIDQMELFNE